MRIDAHQHFWRIGRGDYAWLTADSHPSIHRDFLPADLLPLLRNAKIDKTILVQAAPTLAETHFLLDLARANTFVAGVVGWIDLEAPDAAATVESLARDKGLVGLRPMLQDISDDDWILSPRFAPVLAAMQSTGLRFDALIKPRHLPVIEALLQRHPDLAVVIDHAAKPALIAGRLDEWKAGIRRVATARNVSCKLSGLLTEAGPDGSPVALKSCVDVLLAAFGPERLMWGSDWPVLNEATAYATWLNTVEQLTQHLPSDARAAIFGGTAARFYGVSG